MSHSPASSPLTHFDSHGQAHMVNVGSKTSTHRIALASGRIEMNKKTLDLIKGGTTKKGDVLGIARVAGVMAAKKTSDLIPLCHPLMLTRIAIDFEDFFSTERSTTGIACTATVETFGPTGVEMEALMAVQVALLTIYDMCKAADRKMKIQEILVERKVGGKSDIASDFSA